MFEHQKIGHLLNDLTPAGGVDRKQLGDHGIDKDSQVWAVIRTGEIAGGRAGPCTVDIDDCAQPMPSMSLLIPLIS